MLERGCLHPSGTSKQGIHWGRVRAGSQALLMLFFSHLTLLNQPGCFPTRLLRLAAAPGCSGGSRAANPLARAHGLVEQCRDVGDELALGLILQEPPNTLYVTNTNPRHKAGVFCHPNCSVCKISSTCRG